MSVIDSFSNSVADFTSYKQFYNHIYLVTRSSIRGVGSWNGRSELVLLGYKPFKIRRTLVFFPAFRMKN